MKQISLLLSLLLLTGYNLDAQIQPITISGLVVDKSNYDPVEAAFVLLVQHDGDIERSTITDAGGQFAFKNLQAGDYLLKITHLGLQDYSVEFNIREEMRLGVIRMEPEAIDLDEIEVVEKQPLAIQKGDTTEMNASAYKTLPDASADQLVEKMPTVVIQDGKVQAQGEDVQEVLVDGKAFFGNDPMAALRNLPAEVIEKVQIYDQQSDQAQFTGFDDGERIKTMNIITKASMSNGTFGKLYAGYGTDDRYTAGGNVHFFNDDQRISLLGMSNNINQQNFSSEDLLGVTSSAGRRGFRGGMGGARGGGAGSFSRGGSASDFLVGQQDGIATTHAVGINYTDDWGKKADISASYFFNHSDNDATQFLTRDFVGLGQDAQFYTEEDISTVKNTNHRFSGRINVEIDSMNSLIIRPRLSAQISDGLSNTSAENFMEDQLQSESLQRFVSDLQTLNLSANILWRHKFDRPRRTFSLNVNPSYAPKNGENEFLSSNTFMDAGTALDTIDQRSDLDQNAWGISANLSYTEPLGRYSMMVFDYRLNYQQEESDKITLDFNPETGSYDDLNPFLSNVFSNDYMTHGAGAGWNYRKSDLTLTARANFQFATLMNEQEFPQEGSLDKDFFNILPMVMVRYQLSTTKNLIAVYRGRTQMPTIDQLQNVIDNTNPLLLSAGNPDLDQSFQHNFFLRYSSAQVEKSSIFFAMIGGAYGHDYITNATYTGRVDIPGYPEVELPRGAQFTLPVNLDGFWNIRSFITYGFPIRKIKSNLNLNLTGGYTRIPGLSNETETESKNTNTTLGAVLSSNISDRIDFNLSSRSSLNWIRNTAQNAADNNYFQQSTRLRLNVVVGPGITIRNDFSHEFYSGFSDNFDSNFILWNLSIGKRLFKDQKGELSIVAFDLLKQNTNLARNVTDVYVEDIQTNVLQQYFLLKFTYNLRNFDMPIPEDNSFRPPFRNR